MEYISQFEGNLKLLHKPGKYHILPDAFSRPPRKNTLSTSQEGRLDVLPNETDEIWIFYTGDAEWAMNWVLHQSHLPRIELARTETIDANILIGEHGTTSISLVQMNPQFQRDLQSGYKIDLIFRNILELWKNNPLGPYATVLPFYMDQNKILWKITDGLADRLCVPRKPRFPIIFETFHGDSHAGYAGLAHHLLYCFIPWGATELKKIY